MENFISFSFEIDKIIRTEIHVFILVFPFSNVFSLSNEQLCLQFLCVEF